MASSAVKTTKKTMIASSRRGRDDFASTFVSLLSTPNLEESEEDYAQMEVDDLYNHLVSRHNLRSYFEKAQSAFGQFLFEEPLRETAAKSVQNLLDYKVPGRPLLESDEAKNLYLQASRTIEVQQNLRLAFSILAEEQRKTIRENLSRASGVPGKTSEASPGPSEN